MIPWSYQVMLATLVILAAGFDIRSRRIPNWLVLSGMVWGMAMNLFLYGTAGLKASLIGIGLAFLVYFPLFIVRGMGAGDVKLMMAIGALVGPVNWLTIFVATAILGGVVALALLAWRKRLRQTLHNVWFIVVELLRLRAPYGTDEKLDVHHPNAITMPHGATIAAGTLLFLIRTSLSGTI
jgi:prepilin peptidase CpaA